jgi:hypothetical protein
LFLFDFVDPFLLNMLDLLAHSEELDHFLGIDSSSDELRYGHLVLHFKSVFKIIIVVNVACSVLESLFLLLMLVMGLGELRVDDGERKVE